MNQVDTNVESIEELDFAPALPCEHSMHWLTHNPNELAAWYVHVKCPSCHREKKYFLCESGRIRLMNAPAFHPQCGYQSTEYTWKDLVINIVRIT